MSLKGVLKGGLSGKEIADELIERRTFKPGLFTTDSYVVWFKEKEEEIWHTKMEFFQIIWVIYQLGLIACGLAECLFFGNRFNNGSLFVVISLLFIFLFASQRNENFNLASFCVTSSCLVLHIGLDFFSADIPRAVIYAAIVFIPVFTCALDKKTTLSFCLVTSISIGVVTCATCFAMALPKWYLEYWKHNLFKRGHFLLPHMLKAYVRQKTALYTFMGVLCAVGLMVLFNLIVKLTRSIKSRTCNSAPFLSHSGETMQRRNALTSLDSQEESSSKNSKHLIENPQALPGPQYSSFDWHVHVIAHLKCNGSSVSGQLVELRKKDKPNDIVLDRKDTNGEGMADLGGHDDEDGGIETYVSIKHTCHPRPSCVFCTSKFRVPQNHTCKGPCPEDKFWGIGVELTAYECHCYEPRKAAKYWDD
ncbi:transthyretin-like family domain-containing protein [Ditylenchus destructor]|uniref:Transthyretin-like family domain-containing protein n=1 Tax=Ditylenchus destructor TaxID=166010 RepID=A0AAD4QWN6_9BILA|nr:transthyretin-like family domain-containing protein [Ditylenchus destructor]